MEGWDKNRIPFNVLPLPSRLPPVSRSFLTNTRCWQRVAVCRVSSFLRLPIMNICDFHPRLCASSLFPPAVSPGRFRQPLPPVSPCRICRRSSSLSDLVGGELKHIRPALDSGFIANGGKREFVVPSRALEGTGQPFKSSLKPRSFLWISRFTHSVHLQAADCRMAELSYGKARRVARRVEPIVSDRTIATIAESTGLFPRSRNRLFFLRGQRIADREIRISVIHIYEDAIARGIKINGRVGLIRACTRDAKPRVWVNDIVNNNINATSR